MRELHTPVEDLNRERTYFTMIEGKCDKVSHAAQWAHRRVSKYDKIGVDFPTSLVTSSFDKPNQVIISKIPGNLNHRYLTTVKVALS